MKLALQIRLVWGDVVLDVVHVEPLRTVRFEDLPRCSEGAGRDVLAEVAVEGGGVRLMGGALLPLTAGAGARVTAGALALDVASWRPWGARRRKRLTSIAVCWGTPQGRSCCIWRLSARSRSSFRGWRERMTPRSHATTCS